RVKLLRPEERNSVKLNITPEHVARGCAPLLLRCAPVFDAHAFARARVDETRNIARSVDSFSRAQMRVNENSAVIVQLDTCEKLCGRVNTNTNDDHIRFNTLAIVERDCLNVVLPLEPVNDRAEFETNTMTLVYAPEQRTHFSTERGLERLLGRSNDSYFKTTFAQTVSRLHSDEARANNDHATRTRRCLNN